MVVDMAARQHRQQPYLSLNPYGRVPTLEDDGFVLFESTAILNYLEAIRPAPPLVPADARGRAQVDMHMKLCDLQLTRYSGTIIFPKRFLPKERWNAAAMAEQRQRLRSTSRYSISILLIRPIWLANSSRLPTCATCLFWSFCH